VTDQVLKLAAEEPMDLADMERRIRAILIGSVGNLIEWCDFYATMRDTKHESAMHRHE